MQVVIDCACLRLRATEAGGAFSNMVFRQGVRAVARVARPAALAGASRLAAAKGVQARALAVSAAELSSILEERIKSCMLAGAARVCVARWRAVCVLTPRALCLVGFVVLCCAAPGSAGRWRWGCLARVAAAWVALNNALLVVLSFFFLSFFFPP